MFLARVFWVSLLVFGRVDQPRRICYGRQHRPAQLLEVRPPESWQKQQKQQERSSIVRASWLNVRVSRLGESVIDRINGFDSQLCESFCVALSTKI